MSTKRGALSDVFRVQKRRRTGRVKHEIKSEGGLNDNARHVVEIDSSDNDDTKFSFEEALAREEKRDCQNESVPHATFRFIRYEPRGNRDDTLDEAFGCSSRKVFRSSLNNQKVFQYVFDNYHIPRDFDKNLKYGARSGLCHEERVVQAYENGQLKAKHVGGKERKLCRTCGKSGHFHFACASLLEL
mmetsp:Transcript_16255/g.26508  ORF Transcript_16255/g.26508 Transcript_16255/m.26508 type:complete len:187 (-) Transcript_16255:68-628(-)|eukprot:CAMPEP_0203760320 /NCGR_PEP_ID=MMETSP0098-20131031/13640_1 /ASSEMBLY_ACC=CAM_ASM_000208 /TAXON_ID=96639 /ORGANISM=" , Strain NY0313808BC1" /LENGTH=186 /DNA_ID=CAMNT_0050653833 /DNA_START=538 /DNA_END=1098 /DNA_ORIENTATION=+